MSRSSRINPPKKTQETSCCLLEAFLQARFSALGMCFCAIGLKVTPHTTHAVSKTKPAACRDCHFLEPPHSIRPTASLGK